MTVTGKNNSVYIVLDLITGILSADSVAGVWLIIHNKLVSNLLGLYKSKVTFSSRC